MLDHMSIYAQMLHTAKWESVCGFARKLCGQSCIAQFYGGSSVSKEDWTDAPTILFARILMGVVC